MSFRILPLATYPQKGGGKKIGGGKKKGNGIQEGVLALMSEGNGMETDTFCLKRKRDLGKGERSKKMRPSQKKRACIMTVRPRAGNVRKPKKGPKRKTPTPKGREPSTSATAHLSNYSGTVFYPKRRWRKMGGEN